MDEALAWAEKSGLSVDDELHYSSTQQFPTRSELNYLTYARVLLAQGRSQSSPSHLQDALQLLNRLYEFSKAGGRTIRMMETLLLQALVLHAQGERERSLNCLERALSIPRHGNYIRLFLDEGKPMRELLQSAISKNIHSREVNSLLAAFASAKEKKFASVPQLIEPLSDRELEVLHYLATGMSNQAIADRLFVSLAAVKWHARNIYGKLEVNNRTGAVARARELGILE